MRRPGPRVTASGLRRAFADLSLAALCLAFAYGQLRAFALTHRASAPLFVATELLFAAFAVFRRPADDVSRSPWDWFATFAGTAAPLLLQPTAAPHDLVAAQALQIFGAAGCVLGILSLNRSAGVVPAHREVKSSGAYRLVRHPLYASYAITDLGYVLSNSSGWNTVVLAAGFAFQVARIFNEERLLSAHESYRAYQARTRWRLLPFVF
ncbi:MAG TPA: methyltransferase [Anaeromyxobacteraceae bacterium]